MTARIIAVMSPKGGVGKTTVSVNLSAALGLLGKKVLIIDTNLDTPHVAIYYGFVGYKYSLEDVLNGLATVSDAVYKTDEDNVDILPSRVIKGLGDGNASYKLINVFHHIKKLGENYDYIILDSRPSSGIDVVKLINGVEALIVTMPEIASIIEAKKLNEACIGARIKVVGLVVNKTNKRALAAMSEGEIRSLVEIERLWKVPEDHAVFAALRRGVPIVVSDKKNGVSRAFMDLARAITR